MEKLLFQNLKMFFFELNKEIDLNQLNIKKISKENYNLIEKFLLPVENEKVNSS